MSTVSGPARRALLGAAVAGLLTTTGGAAHADPPGLVGISRDGVHWDADPSQPLFDPAVRWVPGDSRVVHLYVRNQATDGADLSVVVERTAPDGIAGTGWLHISAQGGSSPWRSVDDADRHQLVQLADIAPGEVVPVQLRVSLDRRAPNRTMVLSSRLGLQFELTEAVAGPGAGELPNTGSPVRPWLVALASFLIACGVVLARRSAPRLSEPSP